MTIETLRIYHAKELLESIRYVIDDSVCLEGGNYCLSESKYCFPVLWIFCDVLKCFRTLIEQKLCHVL